MKIYASFSQAIADGYRVVERSTAGYLFQQRIGDTVLHAAWLPERNK